VAAIGYENIEPAIEIVVEEEIHEGK